MKISFLQQATQEMNLMLTCRTNWRIDEDYFEQQYMKQLATSNRIQVIVSLFYDLCVAVQNIVDFSVS